MDWITPLRGHVIGLDTAPIIYFMEENPTYLDIVDPFFAALDRGEFHAVTSTVTLVEVLVHPLRYGYAKLAQQYRDILFHAANIQMLPLSQEIAEAAARLRAVHGFRTPDAIQIATAIQTGASFFLTNDARLASSPTLTTIILDKLTEQR